MLPSHLVPKFPNETTLNEGLVPFVNGVLDFSRELYGRSSLTKQPLEDVGSFLSSCDGVAIEGKQAFNDEIAENIWKGISRNQLLKELRESREVLDMFGLFAAEKWVAEFSLAVLESDGAQADAWGAGTTNNGKKSKPRQKRDRVNDAISTKKVKEHGAKSGDSDSSDAEKENSQDSWIGYIQSIKKSLNIAGDEVEAQITSNSGKWLYISDSLACARALIHNREYKRCSSFLQTVEEKISGFKANAENLTQEEHSIISASLELSSFLRLYSIFLCGERERQRIDEEQRPSATSHKFPSNKEIPGIRNELLSILLLEKDKHQTDAKSLKLNPRKPMHLYLYGLCMKEDNLVDAAIEALLLSVTTFSWNWSAWIALVLLLPTSVQLENLLPRLPHNPASVIFRAYSARELQMNVVAAKRLENLRIRFPNSSFILRQLAQAYHNIQNYPAAEAIYEELRRRDPYLLDGMELYSNILYVKEYTDKLCWLAHEAVKIDPYRPETCCIVGNYYSLRGEHEKAVLYFQKAVKLDANFLSAWTLLGHEFVELKNTPAAVFAYRRAVDTNQHDYRAWYGLGQTYELMRMEKYALYYYRKAAALRPYDSRMWCAMAGCFERNGEIKEAITCYERAEQTNDRDGIAVTKLAGLHSKAGREDVAAFYYKKNLESKSKQHIEGPDTEDALLFLAKHCITSKKWEEATEYCVRLMDYAGKGKEEAKALLRLIRDAQQQQRKSGILSEFETSSMIMEEDSYIADDFSLTDL